MSDNIVKSAGVQQNPKHIQAQKEGKLPMEYLVYDVLIEEALVLKHGADKYGVRNWRKDKILASTYEGAIMRHLFAWATGHDLDPDSGRSHLAHIRACCAVVLDAIQHGTLIDDRNRCETSHSHKEKQHALRQGKADLPQRRYTSL